MATERAEAIRLDVTRELARLIPRERDDAWLERMVGHTRFDWGWTWDWDALLHGFFEPLGRWVDAHPARRMPVLSGLTIEALDAASDRYADVLAILELQDQTLMMLDDVGNARELWQAETGAVEIPLPSWVTVAYNVRQLVPVLVARQESALSEEGRRWLTRRCTRFLFRQGMASTLDLWGSEQRHEHASGEEFEDHLRMYVGTLGFGSACDFTSAVVGLASSDADRLRHAGVELGIAFRLSLLAAGESGTRRDAFGEAVQAVHWWHGVVPDELSGMAARATDRALDLAKAFDPSVADAFEQFLSSCGTPVTEGDRS